MFASNSEDVAAAGCELDQPHPPHESKIELMMHPQELHRLLLGFEQQRRRPRPQASFQAYTIYTPSSTGVL